MKYIVMECHEGYAVLMDEEARFVKAANLHYQTGQSVTDPVLMNDEHRARRITMNIGRFAAVAACFIVLASAGSIYYARNLKPYSTILISSDANIRMDVNQKGKVIRLKSDDESGKNLLKDYEGKGKDKLTVANEIIELEKEKGIISEGDTVNIYVDSDNSREYASFRTELESGIPDLKVKVKGLDAPKPPANEKKEKKDAEKTPKPTNKNDEKAPEPLKPSAENKTIPKLPAVTPSSDTSETPKVKPPHPEKNAEPAVIPSAASEPPKAHKKHDDENNAEPHKPDESLQPETPNEPEPLKPESKKPANEELLFEEAEEFAPLNIEELRPAILLPEPKKNVAPPEKEPAEEKLPDEESPEPLP